MPVGRDEAAGAFVPARDSGNDYIADDKRRGSGAVVLPPIGHPRIPQQIAGEAVERHDVRVVGDQEQPIACDGGAAVDARGGVSREALRPRARVPPKLTARARIERDAFVHVGDVHHALDHQRRGLQSTRAADVVDPRGRQAADVGGVDLIEFAMAVAADIAVVGGPVGLGSHPTKLVAGGAQ